MNKTKIPDEDYNKNFQALLSEFQSIDAKKKDAKEKYAALKEKVKGVYPLSYTQRAAIEQRCDNAINGTYNFGEHNYKANEYDQKRTENKK